ncbi:MAG: putative lipid II flippase FtsW [Chthoniobacterales bacterium]|nr:putative lipid II flippase FtsW [Chthoniobacterales bacterium]
MNGRIHRFSIQVLLSAVLLLMALGIVMLTSTGAFAEDNRGDVYYFLKRQVIWAILGVSVCITVSRIETDYWKRVWWFFYGMALVLLVLCFVPPIGMRINGSWRWINLGILVFQPSELAKVAVIVFLAWWFDKEGRAGKGFLKGILMPGIFLVPILGLIAMEVDIGTTVLVAAIAFGMMFVAGVSLWYLAGIMSLVFVGMLFMAMQIGERASRLLAFLKPDEYRLSEGLQQWQALIAFGSGGLMGLGLGEGRQKLKYLPYAHTDFIFPMVGEELGLVFTLGVVLLYVLICLTGFWIASHGKDRFSGLLGFGFVLCIVLQAAVNIGVTTSVLPNKGMPLPFVSYGGSNLVICWFMIGVMISIYRRARVLEVEPEKRLLENRPVLRLRV